MSKRADTSESGPFLVFDVGVEGDTLDGATFALDVRHVSQVIEPGALSPVPLAPAVVLGLLSHRGRIVTLVDPAPLLEFEPQPTPVANAVILRHEVAGPAHLGFRVGRIHGIVGRGDIAAVDVELRPCVAWVAQAGRRLIHVLDLQPLLERLSRLFGSSDSRPLVQGVRA
jgi:chemotaxis signal transduction protein